MCQSLLLFRSVVFCVFLCLTLSGSLTAALTLFPALSISLLVSHPFSYIISCFYTLSFSLPSVYESLCKACAIIMPLMALPWASRSRRLLGRSPPGSSWLDGRICTQRLSVSTCPSGTHDTPPVSAILGRECVPCSLSWQAQTCVCVCVYMCEFKVRRICWVSFNGKYLFASLFQTVNMKPIPQQSVWGSRAWHRIAENSQAAENKIKTFCFWLGFFSSFLCTHTHTHVKKAPVVKNVPTPSNPTGTWQLLGYCSCVEGGARGRSEVCRGGRGSQDQGSEVTGWRSRPGLGSKLAKSRDWHYKRVQAAAREGTTFSTHLEERGGEKERKYEQLTHASFCCDLAAVYRCLIKDIKATSVGVGYLNSHFNPPLSHFLILFALFLSLSLYPCLRLISLPSCTNSLLTQKCQKCKAVYLTPSARTNKAFCKTHTHTYTQRSPM